MSRLSPIESLGDAGESRQHFKDADLGTESAQPIFQTAPSNFSTGIP